MQQILMLLSLVSLAFAAPQYSYGQPTSGSSGILNRVDISGGSGISGINHIGNGGSVSGTSIHGVASNHGVHGIGSNSAQRFHHQPAATNNIVYHKQIYFHDAPEEDLTELSSRSADSLTQRQNIRIVFIKTPENKALENAALQIAKSTSEDKTAIYVLNKQSDVGDLQSKISQIQDSTVNKPEVHFIKYKTPEEIDYAQKTIQAQYDQLQGPTDLSNEGVAPVQNFVGVLGGGQPSGVYANRNGGHIGQGSSYAPQQSYLPPSTSYLPSR